MWGLCTLVALVIISVTQWVYRFRNPRCKNGGKLPLGSMGLPLIGETLQFLASNPSYDIPPFIKTRMQRYGPVFKSHLMGAPFIVSTDQELNYFVFQQDEKLFRSGYPDSISKLFGQQRLDALHTQAYKYLKGVMLNVLGPDSLRKMLPEIEQATRAGLQQWSCRDTIEFKQAITNMTFALTTKKLMGYQSAESTESLRKNFDDFGRGMISLFPFPIPGTAFYKCLQGRKSVLRILKEMLEERRAKSLDREPVDFFDRVLEELRKEGTIMTEEIAFDLMFGMIFTSLESTSTALTLVLHFISQHPTVLKQLMEEHDMILKQRGHGESGLTWKECKSMTFTMQIINETARFANIVPGIFRKAIEEVQFKGYTIPEGWSVLVCPQRQHLNPETYENPMAFNPWRWEGKDNGASKHFMAFGGGLRSCVGADFAKLQMAVFLHCLVTSYSWEAVSGGNIVRGPHINFPDGFHIRISQKDAIY